jgi:hypothetical protein
MDDNQSVLLVLKTSDLISGVSKNSTNANMTWNDINLQHLLGDMWDNKYENFNLQLVSINSGNQGNVISLPGGLFNSLNINISGFDFTAYDTGRKLITQNVIIAGYIDVLTTRLNIRGDTNIRTFNKSSEIININIFYTINNSSYTNQSLMTFLQGVGWGFFDQVFIFRITGCNLHENINMEQRIF